MDIHKLECIEPLEEVLGRLGGNEAILIKLLQKFYGLYNNSRKDLLILLQNKNKEEAHRLVHTIKGVAGNLSIKKVYESALALDLRMKEGFYEETSIEAINFCQNLDEAIEDLKSQLYT